jgi:CheY-like chemotaxis protein
MSKIYILCVEDEPDVLDSVVRDLEELEDIFPVEAVGNADEARSVLESLHAEGHEVGVIFCDHIMPGESGVDLLVALRQDPRFAFTRKVLLTGQAGLEATVKAVNEARLAHYVAKPWESDELIWVAKAQMTRYFQERDINPWPYLRGLDVEDLEDLMRRHAADGGNV